MEFNFAFVNAIEMFIVPITANQKEFLRHWVLPKKGERREKLIKLCKLELDERDEFHPRSLQFVPQSMLLSAEHRKWNYLIIPRSA